MKWWLLGIFVVIVLSGCARTDVVYYPLEQIKQTTTEIQETEEVQEEQDTDPTTVTNFTEPVFKEGTEDSAEDAEQEETIESQTFVISNYTITNCCNFGRMDVTINAEESNYDVDQIKDTILAIYYENCNRFPDSIQHSIYVLFSNQVYGNTRNHMISFVDVSHNVLIIKGSYQEANFKNCLADNVSY